MGDIRLRIGAYDFPEWNDIRVFRTIQHLSGEFELKVWGNWQAPGMNLHSLAGQPCQIFTGKKKLVLSGYVDADSRSYDATNHVATIKGRDKTSDLVDCSVLASDMNGGMTVLRSLLGIAQDICPAFGIRVINEAGEIPACKNFSPNFNSTVFDTLDTLARLMGVLLTSDANGNLVITRAGLKRATTKLELGKNILSGQGGTDLHNCFSEYRLRNQDFLGTSVRNDPDLKLLALHRSTDSRFTQLGRHRPLLLNSPEILDDDLLQKRVEWERNVRFGRSKAMTYKVQGWLQESGELWEPNQIVHVVDPYQGIDGDRLITDVTYTQSPDPQGGGTRCEITVMPPKAFSLIPHPEEDI